MVDQAKGVLSVGSVAFILWNVINIRFWLDVADGTIWLEIATPMIIERAVNIFLGVCLLAYAITDSNRDSGLHEAVRDLRSELRDLKYGSYDTDPRATTMEEEVPQES